MIIVKISWKCKRTRLLLNCRRNRYNWFVSALSLSLCLFYTVAIRFWAKLLTLHTLIVKTHRKVWNCNCVLLLFYFFLKKKTSVLSNLGCGVTDYSENENSAIEIYSQHLTFPLGFYLTSFGLWSPDTPKRILADTYPRSIKINYFNFFKKLIRYLKDTPQILIRYFKVMYPMKDEE